MRFRETNEVISMIRTPEEGYSALRAAVIAMACDDYLRAYSLHDSMRMSTIEKFFLNDRFLLFSDGVEGAYVLERLKKMNMRDKYKPRRESKPVRRYDKHGNLLAEYGSVADAAWDMHGDQRSISRACRNGAECYESYWEFV